MPTMGWSFYSRPENPPRRKSKVGNGFHPKKPKR